MNPLEPLIAAVTVPPTVPPTPVDPAAVTPGPLGFFATVALMLAVGLIAVAMMNRMSRLHARYSVREELEREEAARLAAEAAGEPAAENAATPEESAAPESGPAEPTERQ